MIRCVQTLGDKRALAQTVKVRKHSFKQLLSAAGGHVDMVVGQAQTHVAFFGSVCNTLHTWRLRA